MSHPLLRLARTRDERVLHSDQNLARELLVVVGDSDRITGMQPRDVLAAAFAQCGEELRFICVGLGDKLFGRQVAVTLSQCRARSMANRRGEGLGVRPVEHFADLLGDLPVAYRGARVDLE